MTTAPPLVASPTAHRVPAAALVTGSVTLLASSVAYHVAGSEVVGGALGIPAAALLVAAAPGLTAPLRERSPGLAATLTALFAGCFAIGGVGFNLESILRAHGGPPLDGLAVFPVVALPGVLGPLVLAAIGVALHRRGAAPRFAGPALAVAGVLFPVSRIFDVGPLALAVDALLVAAAAGLARSRTARAAR